MWKKEITDTLKQTALVMSFLLLMPIVFSINNLRFPEADLSFLWYIEWGISLLIVFLTFYLAYNMFASDDNDSAAEYLKSLPLSKWKLLAVKVIPRLVVVLFFVLTHVHLVIYHHRVLALVGVSESTRLLYRFAFLPNAGLFLIIMLAGFMLGISDRKNPFLVIALAIPVLYMMFGEASISRSMHHSIYHWWYGHFGYMYSNVYRSIISLSTTTLQIHLPVIVSLSVLIPVYKSWDTSSGKIRSARILKRMAVPLGLIIALFTLNQLHVF